MYDPRDLHFLDVRFLGLRFLNTPHTVHNLTEFSTYLYRRQTFLMTINVNGQVSWPFD